jgi:uncharacterized DUF497 family protein
MEITYDSNKSERNITERGLSFERAADFELATAITKIDNRREYGETRYMSIGFLDDRLHVMCFTETELGIRVISFRKANQREVKNYETLKATI